MAKSFNQLPGFMSKLSRRIPKSVASVVKTAARAAGTTAVRSTRVDTGKARSNWRANLDGPALGVIPPYSPGNKLGISENANASRAISQQRSVIQTFGIPKNRAIFISNSVPYIGFLNNGGKNVAPGLMAEKAIQSARLSIAGQNFFGAFS